MSYSLLKPVYQFAKKGEPLSADDTMIPLEEVTNVSSATLAASESCCEKKSDSDKQSKCKRSRITCCGFFARLFVFSITVMTLGSLFAIGFTMVKIDRCLHPRSVRTTEYIFEDSEVEGFDLSAVSGEVSIHTCPHIEKLTLLVSTSAHGVDLLDTMNAKTQVLDGIFQHSVDSPSFDFRHCQLTRYHLTVPTRLSNRLNIKAHVLMGGISVATEDYEFESMELAVEVGVVNAHHTTVRGLLQASARVGVINTKHIEAAELLLAADTGFVRSKHAKAQVGLASSNHGALTLNHWDVTRLRAETNMGIMHLRNVPQTEFLEAKMQYGHLDFQPTKNWYGQFEVTSPYGFVSHKSAKSALPHVLEINDEAHIKGQVAAVGDQILPPAEVTLSSVWGSVHVFRRSAHYNHNQQNRHHDDPEPL